MKQDVIALHNDGKEKYQSFEAIIQADEPSYPFGYGADKEEAVENLKRSLAIYAQFYVDLLTRFENLSTIKVDFSGKEIKP